MSTQFEVILLDATSPDGEIRLTDLAAIAQSFQELSLRIGRSRAESEGPGRTKRTIDEMTQLRLRSIEPGSTKLLLAQGPSDELELDLEDSREIAQMFWEVIDGVGADARPDWVSDLVADSAAGVVAALQSAAPVVVVTRDDREDIRIRTELIHRETWTTERLVRGEDSVLVSGTLEKVDLRSHDFRVRDDAGNAIELHDVSDPGTAAHLVGTHVTAAGIAVRNRAGRLSGLSGPEVQAEGDAVSRFRVPSSTSIAEILESAPGPDPDGGIELTDEEFAKFLESIGS